MRKIAILFLTLAATTLTAYAQHGQTKWHKDGSKDGGSNVQVYRFNGSSYGIPNLSQEQKDEIKNLRLEMAKETTSLRNQLAEKRARLNTLKSEDNANMSAINKTIDEIATLQAQQMKAKASFHVKVRALLNDEQKVAFDSRRHHNFNFNFDKGIGQMRVKSFKLGDADFGDLNERLKGLESFNDMDFDSIFGQHFEFEVND